jgi:hypothetical protein
VLEEMFFHGSSFFLNLAAELVGPKKKLLTAIIAQYLFNVDGIVIFVAYFIQEWRRLTITLSIVTIPFTFFYL